VIQGIRKSTRGKHGREETLERAPDQSVDGKKDDSLVAHIPYVQKFFFQSIKKNNG
jgi:hypothetical protein